MQPKDGSTARIQRDSPGGHWDYVPLGESIRTPRDDHTPRIQKTCHTRDANGARNKGRGLTFSISCEVWQRISVSYRVQHMWLMPFVSSMVSLSALPSILHQLRLLCMVREKNTQGIHGSIRWNLVANMCHFNLSEHYIVGPTRQSSSFSWKIGRKTRTGLTLDSQHCTIHLALNHIPSTHVCPVCCPAWPRI